jgi:hypothetical protein
MGEVTMKKLYIDSPWMFQVIEGPAMDDRQETLLNRCYLEGGECVADSSRDVSVGAFQFV